MGAMSALVIRWRHQLNPFLPHFTRPNGSAVVYVVNDQPSSAGSLDSWRVSARRMFGGPAVGQVDERHVAPGFGSAMPPASARPCGPSWMRGGGRRVRRYETRSPRSRLR